MRWLLLCFFISVTAFADVYEPFPITQQDMGSEAQWNEKLR